MINPEEFKDKAIAIATKEETEVKFIAAVLLDKNGKATTTWRLENVDLPAMFNIIGQLERIKAQTLAQIENLDKDKYSYTLSPGSPDNRQEKK